jgi:PKD repeat protein
MKKMFLILVTFHLLFTNMSSADMDVFTYQLTQSTTDLTIWTTMPSDRVFKDDAVPIEKGSSVKLAAAKNEFEPFIVVVKPESSQSLRVGIDDFGNNITCEIYQVKYVNITQVSDNLGQTGDYPDPLWPIENNTSVQFTRRENTAFWFSIYIPVAVAPGDYSSIVHIGNIDIPIQLHIFNFAIPNELHVRSQMNFSYQTILNHYDVSDGYWMYVEKIKQFFINHRLTPKSVLWPGGLTGTGGDCFISYDCATGTLTDPHDIWGFETPANQYLNGHDFNDGTGFPSFMAITFQNNDASADQRPQTFCDISRSDSDWYEFNNPQTPYNNKWFAYISHLMQYLKDHQYLDKAYYYFANEPQDQTDYDAVAWYSQELKRAAPELKLMLSEEPKPEIYDHQEFPNAKIDIWLPVLHQYDIEKSHDRAKNHNEDTWIYFLHGTRPPYFNPITLDHPGIESKLTGWFLWKYRIRGIAYYSLNNWSKNPWTNPMNDNHNGDLFMLYPPSETNNKIAYGSNNHRMLPSMRLELMRDSLEDYEYLYVFNQSSQPEVDQVNAADHQVDKIISGLTSYTRNDQFMYNLRWQIGLKNGNEIQTIPDIQPPNQHPRTLGEPGNYYINFQEPDNKPLDNPLIIDQKSYMKIGWNEYSETNGYGWFGDMQHVMYRYLDSGTDPRQNSILYDDWGRQKTFEFDLPNGQYQVTVSVGWHGRSYAHNQIDIEGVSFVSDEVSDPYIVRTREIEIKDNKLTMQMGIFNEYTMLNYMDIEAIHAQDQIITPLIIKETLGIDRDNEMVCNGIPVSRIDDIKDKSALYISDDNGNKISACFEVLSRWAGGKDDRSCPIQWLMVSFPATVLANQTRLYYLTSGQPKQPEMKVSVTENDQHYHVSTGVASFVIPKDRLGLFSSISADSNEIVSSINHLGSHSQILGQNIAHAAPPTAAIIERQNDHHLIIKLTGNYTNEAVGTSSAKPLSYKIRYEFFAGSPTSVIYHKFYWAGSNGGYNNGDPITVNHVSLSLPSINAYESTDVYADSSIFFTGKLISTELASVCQRKRDVFTNPHVAEIKHGSQMTTIPLATQPMIINRSQYGDIAVTIDHMQYFEPQSIASSANGSITINEMASSQYFADYQGTWARVGVSALPSGTSYKTALSQMYAPLNNRLFAFPPNDYCVKSSVFLETPYTPDDQSPEIKKYYESLKAVTQTTRKFLVQEKFQGLMTWGALVRYASLNGFSETGSNTGWDKIYSNGTLTDYHGAWKNVIFQFLMEGNPDHLYDLSFMGARRMLHTQIYQPDNPENPSNVYMGWAPTGYDEYRSDFNSSHSYFDNLFTYYYLTGDMEVIDILKLAGRSKKRIYTRDPGADWQYQALNDPFTGGAEWVGYVGRVAMQSASIFHFLGHVYDANYLDDFKHMFCHAFNRSLALLKNNNTDTEYTFLSNEKNIESGFTTSQHWMVSLYFMQNLYLLYDEWGDITPGPENVSISRVFSGLANTYMTFVSRDDFRAFCQGQSGCASEADGSWPGSWNNRDVIQFEGNRIGGNLISIEDNDGSSDACLWTTGKSPIITQILRAGKMTDNAQQIIFGREGISYMAQAIESIGENTPWSKETSMYFIRLHHAMAYLSEPAPFVAQFEIQTAQGTAPLTVSFSDQSTGTITQWAWDLNGDGQVDSTQQNPIFTYETPGEYSVTLWVKNTLGETQTKQKVNAVNVYSESDDQLFTSVLQQDCTGFSRCYVSLKDWEDDFGGIDFLSCAQGNLVCLKHSAVITIQGKFSDADTKALTIDGWTTDSNYRIEIRTKGDARHKGVWDNSAYRLEIIATANYQAPIYIQDDYVLIDGLQIRINPNGYQSTRGITSNNIHPDHNLIQISNTIIQSTGDGESTQAVATFDPDARYHIWNNIIYDFDSYAIKANAKFVVYNNTVYQCNQGINSGGAIIKNNAVFHSTSGFDYANNFSDQSTNNASSDNTANNAEYHLLNGLTGLLAENQFIAVAQRDFRNKPGATIINKGIDLSKDDLLSFDDDITGKKRSMWGMGAHGFFLNGDVNNDMNLNLKDVLILLQALGDI